MPWRPLLVSLLVVGGCASGAPDGAYYPTPRHPDTTGLAEALHRAASAAGDDPARYSFALIASRDVAAFSGAEEATFYFTEGLARQAPELRDALVAREVAHEILGHAGQRRRLSWSMTAGFTAVGFLVPGLSLMDLVVNPLLVRAFNRDQVIAADLKSLDILAGMGHAAPRRTLADALRAAAAINGPRHGGWLASEPDLSARLDAIAPLERTPDVATRRTPPALR
jgi:hypothetical protein